jgi:hypothetical protein
VALIEKININDFLTQFLTSLNLSTSYSITSQETIAQLVRRVAGYSCPCSKSKITRTVLNLIKYLFDQEEGLNDLIEDTFEKIVTIGDLIETRRSDEENMSVQVMYFSSPLKYIKISDYKLLLLGINNDNNEFLPHTILINIKYRGTFRLLDFSELNFEETRRILEEVGYVEIKTSDWLSYSENITFEKHLSIYNRKLSSIDVHPEKVDSLEIVSSFDGSQFYRGRWQQVNRLHTGRFVARRNTSKYEGHIWGYVELENGLLQRSIDFPLTGKRCRGCDEAWRLQMALDKNNGKPQQFRIVQLDNDKISLEFFSPIPMWTIRRISLSGDETKATSSLFSFIIPSIELNDIKRILVNDLWLEEKIYL